MRRTVALLCLAFAAAPLAAQTSDAASRLHDLFRREWELRLREEPLLATSVDRHEYDDRLPSVALEDLARYVDATLAFLAELDAIDRAFLPTADRTHADIFRRQLEDRVADYRLGDWQVPFNADSGFHTGFAQLPSQVPLGTVRDYENYIARLRAWPAHVGQQIANLRAGLQRGMTVPRVVLDGYEGTIAAHVVEDPAKSVFHRPFERFPATFPEAERERLRAAGRAAILEGVVPGYRAFLAFFRDEYLPGARTTIGASELPEGRAYYAHQVRRFTTLEMTPEEIHRLGLAEVARIRGEMDAVMKKVGFSGDFPAFLKHLRTDPRFYAKSPEELLSRAAWIAKRMDGKLPALFGTLPRLPYTVEPVPDHLAPKYTSGRYVEAPQGGTQPGIYWVNTYKLESRPLYNLEALTLHEAVPGHHLQISRAQELSGLPDFRRFTYLSVFGEGWGLYSEWLGIEAGFYTDPYSEFGRLTYEMWRACRLVVDTGLHAMGWGRQQAMDYLASHTALPLHEVETETDRYISWPGQALAYKIGELKIKELRRRAEQALGERFDVRAFHDAVIGEGSVPLGVLEANVDRFIAERRAAGAASSAPSGR
ncbi:MAG TPA: DUF885 domain-containing protein [Thermoanaerobaculia bacterium]|nr:DUF885 domain-containing protein [Thermoanaerobaculia bacterium]